MALRSYASLADESSSPLVRAASTLALQDVVQLAYLACLLAAVYRGAGPERPGALAWLLFDALVFVAGVVAWRGVSKPSRAARNAYRVATCAPVIATFGQLHLILPTASDLRLDAALLAFDEGVLRYEPSLAWDARVSPALTEWFSFFYLGYFAVLALHVVPVLGFERRGRVLAEFSLGIVTVYCAGHALYLAVPALGPWVHLAGEFHTPLRGDFWYPLMCRVVAAGGARTDVFPSLHTAGPAFIAMFSFRHRALRPFRYTWPLVAFVASQIIAATMYLRWHYLIDVIAGLALAAAAAYGAKALCAWESTARARRALPPVW
jgi:membrane-associated phospholipid phosphatase